MKFICLLNTVWENVEKDWPTLVARLISLACNPFKRLIQFTTPSISRFGAACELRFCHNSFASVCGVRIFFCFHFRIFLSFMLISNPFEYEKWKWDWIYWQSHSHSLTIYIQSFWEFSVQSNVVRFSRKIPPDELPNHHQHPPRREISFLLISRWGGGEEKKRKKIVFVVLCRHPSDRYTTQPKASTQCVDIDCISSIE